VKPRLDRRGKDKSVTISAKRPPLRVAGLFAGIGGVEYGLAAAGHDTTLRCEIDDAAGAVLSAHYPDVPLVPDVRDVRNVSGIDLLAAGFPCQDLSQAGRTAGINGKKSGLVGEVLRLVRDFDPRWLLLENVPFMLALDGGRGMLYLTTWLSNLGFRWAYRVVDTRAFGLPQRRQRVLLLASRSEDPRNVLFADDAGAPRKSVTVALPHGAARNRERQLLHAPGLPSSGHTCDTDASPGHFAAPPTVKCTGRFGNDELRSGSSAA
jgi:DNA-cytosine methyltransferase